MKPTETELRIGEEILIAVRDLLRILAPRLTVAQSFNIMADVLVLLGGLVALLLLRNTLDGFRAFILAVPVVFFPAFCWYYTSRTARFRTPPHPR
jgi:hypothetical protein